MKFPLLKKLQKARSQKEFGGGLRNRVEGGGNRIRGGGGGGGLVVVVV